MQTRELQQWEEFQQHVQQRKGRIIILDKFSYTAPADEPAPYGVGWDK